MKGRGKGKKRRLDDSGEPSVMRKLSFTDAGQSVPESVDDGEATEPEAAASSVNPKAEVAEQTLLPTQESLEILKAIAELEYAGGPEASSTSAPSRPSAVSVVAPENGAVEDVVSAAEAVPASSSKDDSPGAPSCSSLSRRCRCCSSWSSLFTRWPCCSSCSSLFTRWPCCSSCSR